jgi:hypothetical protein
MTGKRNLRDFEEICKSSSLEPIQAYLDAKMLFAFLLLIIFNALFFGLACQVGACRNPPLYIKIFLIIGVPLLAAGMLKTIIYFVLHKPLIVIDSKKILISQNIFAVGEIKWPDINNICVTKRSSQGPLYSFVGLNIKSDALHSYGALKRFNIKLNKLFSGFPATINGFYLGLSAQDICRVLCHYKKLVQSAEQLECQTLPFA